MDVVPWLLIALNLIGAGILARFGLPKDVPLVGTEGADPLLGYVGLTILITSIAIRVALTVSGA